MENSDESEKVTSLDLDIRKIDAALDNIVDHLGPPPPNLAKAGRMKWYIY